MAVYRVMTRKREYNSVSGPVQFQEVRRAYEDNTETLSVQRYNPEAWVWEDLLAFAGWVSGEEWEIHPEVTTAAVREVALDLPPTALPLENLLDRLRRRFRGVEEEVLERVAALAFASGMIELQAVGGRRGSGSVYQRWV